MKISKFLLVKAFFVTCLMVSSNVATSQQAGSYFTGTAPSGEEVKIRISATAKLKYPRRAQRMNAEGFVQLKFDVNEEGQMIDLRVAESEPRLVFDKAAVLYFERMRLDPPKLNGQPVYVSNVSSRLKFKLQ
ncbi:energy transducer TonB [Luminiphilus sp.]|nr:energy transducer TonB [Luminiphilus sp.]